MLLLRIHHGIHIRYQYSAHINRFRSHRAMRSKAGDNEIIEPTQMIRSFLHADRSHAILDHLDYVEMSVGIRLLERIHLIESDAERVNVGRLIVAILIHENLGSAVQCGSYKRHCHIRVDGSTFP